MKWSRVLPWHWVRGTTSPARRPQATVRLALDILEERLVLSAAPLDDAAAYAVWRAQQFTVNDTTSDLADPTIQATTPQNSSFGSLIGLPSAFSNYDYRGTGYSVAVIDTGIDYTNPDLGGGFGSNYRVVAGWDFVNNDADPMDDNGHGTHVAGIIGSSSATYSGVAPNVNLIALKVLDKNGSGTFGAVEDALKWVIANQAKYNIVAINMSLGAGNYTTNPYTFLDDELSVLKSDGVFTSVAAGNSFYTNNSQPGLDFPAVDPYVVSVGAVWDGNYGSVAWASGARDLTTAPDRIASFSQRGPGLSIMAPGALITSTYLNGTYKSMAGTSMAAPVIAGAAVLLHQAMDAQHLTANQDTILKDMQNTGATVVDGDDENDNVVNTGLSFKRIDLAAALDAIGKPSSTPTTPPVTTPNAAPVLQTISNQTVAPGGAIQVTLNATDANGDPITFAAQLVNPVQQAVQLRQQLGLAYAGSYYQNSWGQNEKWMVGTGNVWYCLLPNGQLRRWSGSMATTLQAGNLIATLDAKYYADPNLLLKAQAPSASNTPVLSIVGNQLTITAPAGSVGTYQIQVTASDGKLTSTAQTFTLTVSSNTAPTIAPISTQSLLTNRSQTITLSGQDAQNDPITYSAKLVGTFSTIPATIVVNGNQLTIYTSPDYVGGYDVQVTASDGALSSTTTFHVNVAASPVAYRLKGDFNGDGRQDVAFLNQDGSWWVSLANADGSFVNQNWGQWSAASNWKTVQTGDFNGDGKTDIVGFSTGGSWWVGLSSGSTFNTKLWAQWSAPSNWSTVLVGDVNGDGKTDIVGFMNSGSWWVGLSTGSTFNTKLWTQWSAASGWSSVQLMDVNGDGKLDIVGQQKSTGKWYVGYSTGTSFRVQVWTGSTPPANRGAAASVSAKGSLVQGLTPLDAAIGDWLNALTPNGRK